MFRALEGDSFTVAHTSYLLGIGFCHREVCGHLPGGGLDTERGVIPFSWWAVPSVPVGLPVEVATQNSLELTRMFLFGALAIFPLCLVMTGSCKCHPKETHFAFCMVSALFHSFLCFSKHSG